MPNSKLHFKSFKALNAHLAALDVERAQNLKRAAKLPAPKVGPKVAK